MVFNTTDGTNDIDQPVNRSKHRKTTPTGRKNKTVTSHSSPTKEISPTNQTGKSVNPTGADKATMGNTSAQRSVSDMEDSTQDNSHAESNHTGGKEEGNTSSNGSARLVQPDNIEV